ncbi:hypothetical protein [Flavobacterium sp. TBRC 19031]|uniref:hypothetical protein n=1 Tax=Flavobacterium mekongense TaxID=3379707 RepID=UPI00399A8D2F
MKRLIIMPFFLISLVQREDFKMNGIYRIQYDYSYGSQNGIVNFKGDTYTRKQVNGKKIKGDVDYQQYFVFLNDKNSHLQVKFPKREIGNDTIYFRTIDLNDKSANNDPLTLFAGKLIKVK